MSNHTDDTDPDPTEKPLRRGDPTVRGGRTDTEQLDSQLLLRVMEREDQPTVTDSRLTERLPWSRDEIRTQLDEMSERTLVDSLEIGHGERVWWPLVAPRLSERCRSRIREARVALRMRGWVPFPDPSGDPIDTVRVPEFLAESLREHPSALVGRLGTELKAAQSEPPNYLQSIWEADWSVLALGSYRAVVNPDVESGDLELLDFGHYWFVYQ
jgi:hypothetical protein